MMTDKKDALLNDKTIAKVVNELFKKDDVIEEDENDGIGKYAEVRYLDPKTTKFEHTAGGFISMRIGDDEFYARVNLHRSFPFSRDREYISVRFTTYSGEGVIKDTEIKEAGIIRNIDDFDPVNRKIIEDELNKRYFVPMIEKIKNIKDEFGYTYWEVTTNSGFKRFTAYDLNNNIVPIGQFRLIVIDVDGNRYEIPDYRTIDEKNIKFIEMWL